MIGFLNAADAAKNPSVKSQGLEITHGKYVVVDSNWATSGSRSVLVMWMFYISGTLGRFIDIRNDVSA
jgi:hypothetical protein